MSKSKMIDETAKKEVLVDKIKRLEKEIKKLRSHNRTLQDAWHKTEDYLIAVSENKSIKEIFDEIDTKTSLRKIKKKCPNSKCGNNTLNKRNYGEYHIISCSRCGYRNRVNEKGSSTS